MLDPIPRIIRALQRLNDLEALPAAAWVAGLSPVERELAVEQARLGVPSSILAHHDRLVADGRRSLAALAGGRCGCCGKRLRACRGVEGTGPALLEVCEACGVFLVGNGRRTSGGVEPNPAAKP
jgi:hypothetical protein